METKKVTLNNGTVLEVGNTYEFDKFEKGDYFTMLFIGDYKMVYKYNNSKYNDGVNEVAMSIDNNLMIIPYTPPTPQKEWKTFLIEFSGIKYRAILQYETLEQAQFHHPNAISITEVRINLEEVK